MYVVMGTRAGEAGGKVMAECHYKLDNLCAVIDRNRLQISAAPRM